MDTVKYIRETTELKIKEAKIVANRKQELQESMEPALFEDLKSMMEGISGSLLKINSIKDSFSFAKEWVRIKDAVEIHKTFIPEDVYNYYTELLDDVLEMKKREHKVYTRLKNVGVMWDKEEFDGFYIVDDYDELIYTFSNANYRYGDFK